MSFCIGNLASMPASAPGPTPSLFCIGASLAPSKLLMGGDSCFTAEEEGSRVMLMSGSASSSS